MPTYPHIEHYYAAKRELIEYGGSDSELNIRPAFQSCLAAYCGDHREKLALVPELRVLSGVVPDGTVKDTLRMARGYWEAKDSHDDLDAEITRKFNRGYPRDNINFEDSLTAVLVQNREEAMRADMSRPGDLHRLIRRFLDYELPQIEEFRQAQKQFKADLPTVLENLRGAVEEAEAENEDYRAAAASFLDLCRQSISPDVSDADVREMLLQHILTEDIFLRVFAEGQFHRENDIAGRLDALEQTFFTGDVRRQAIDRLRAYYGAIGRAADEIADYAEKQGFLKAVYEDFYKAYNPAAADRLGVVYTPNEVVDFIIRGTDHLLQKHFARTLADDNVQILDPATGTGTFITSLIDHLPADRLEYKYLNEMHANEVAILPYYIANLNIEYTYKEKTGRYLGVITARDEWVYDFDTNYLGQKVRAFINLYEEVRAEHGGKAVDNAALGTSIKWTRDLKRQLRLDAPNIFGRQEVRRALFRPFVRRSLYFSRNLNEMQYQLPDVFPQGSTGENKAICFCVNGKAFYVLATDKTVDYHFTGDSQCLPLYRYTPEGERVSNITEWGIRRINEHYRKEWGKDFDNIYPDGIDAEDIFAYTYGVLHDPVYRYDYRVDLLREFPRLPLYHEFDIWARMGRELLDLHVGFESVEPYPLERVEKSHPAQPSSIREVAGPARYATQAQPAPVEDREPALSLPKGEGDPPKPRLRADKERGIIALDDQTSLAGVPPDAWRYRLGTRSALEWVLDQYKEKKPRDPTIRERFNTYRFADHKERVIDLLQRVCAVSVKTMEIVDGMAYWEDGLLIVFGDRDKHEWGMMGVEAMFSEPEDEEWLKQWLEM